MSYRASLYPGALPTASASSSSSAATAAKLADVLDDKQREYAAFEAVRQHANNLNHFLHAFKDRYSTLNGGSEGESPGCFLCADRKHADLAPGPARTAVGDVVEHWQNVFRITALTLGSLAEKRVALAPTVESSDPADVVLPAGTVPDKLVRIPVRPADEEEELLVAQAAGTVRQGDGEADAGQP
ncbi:hypothetical protein JCM8202v2_001348 [Rhodotorula sphaerocarpa]